MTNTKISVDAATLHHTLDAVRTLTDLVRKPGMERLWPWSDWPEDLQSFEGRLLAELKERETGQPS